MSYTINYLLVCVIIVLLFVIIIDKKDEKKEIVSDWIEIRNKNREVIVSQDNFKKVLYNVEKNLKKINKNINEEDCKKVQKYIKKSKESIDEFLKYNKDNKAVCEVIESNDFMRETNILAEKLLNVIDIRKEDITESENSENKRLFAELILDINKLMIISGRSVCFNGKLDLSDMDDLLNTLYKNKCEDNKLEELQENQIDIILSYVSFLPKNKNKNIDTEESMSNRYDINHTAKNKKMVNNISNLLVDKLYSSTQHMNDTNVQNNKKTSKNIQLIKVADVNALRNEYQTKDRNIKGRTSLFN